MRRLDYLGYLLAIAAIVFGSQEFGWGWGIAIIVAMLFGRGLGQPILATAVNETVRCPCAWRGDPRPRTRPV